MGPVSTNHKLQDSLRGRLLGTVNLKPTYVEAQRYEVSDGTKNKHSTDIIFECFFWENRRTIYGVPMTISFSSSLLPFLANDEDVQVLCMYYRTNWYFHSNILDSLRAWLAGFQLNPVFLFPPSFFVSESTIFEWKCQLLRYTAVQSKPVCPLLQFYFNNHLNLQGFHRTPSRNYQYHPKHVLLHFQQVIEKQQDQKIICNLKFHIVTNWATKRTLMAYSW